VEGGKYNLNYSAQSILLSPGPLRKRGYRSGIPLTQGYPPLADGNLYPGKASD